MIQSSIKADDLFLNLLLDPTIAGRSGGFTPVVRRPAFAAEDDALAYAEKRPATASERDAYAMATKAPLLSPQPLNRWSVWGAGYGGSATIERQRRGRLARHSRRGSGAWSAAPTTRFRRTP